MSDPNPTLLQQADALISADRMADYGPYEENAARIASLWSTILGITISPEQVSLCLVALKIARLVSQPNHYDSWLDIAGYAGCTGTLPSMQRSGQEPTVTQTPKGWDPTTTKPQKPPVVIKHTCTRSDLYRLADGSDRWRCATCGTSISGTTYASYGFPPVEGIDRE